MSPSEDISTQKMVYKGKELSFGRYLFNQCLPEDYPVIDTVVTKSKLHKIIDDIVLRYPADKTIETLDNIKKLGFLLSTHAGFSLSLKDLYNEDLLKYAEEIYKTASVNIHTLENNIDLKTKLKEMPFAIFIESGARGTWDQAKQMVFSRGFIADANNNIMASPIKSSLVKGLTQGEFFDSCYGSRKGLLDTALSTGEAGYLTRQLIYSTADIELGEVDDCGTEETLLYKIETEKDVKPIRWRYYIEDGKRKLIKTSDMESLIGKEIQLRSPIYCKSDKICKTCYGNLSNILHSSQVGIIATQTIGEKATQLVLRTFHTSGSASSRTNKSGRHSNKNDDIISGMNIVKKIFHKPTSFKGADNADSLVRLVRSVFEKFGDILSVHFEVIVSSMMWVENTRWRIHPNRHLIKPEFVSILQVPSRTSWLVGCAFSNLKQKLIEGVVYGDQDQKSSITELFRF